MPAIYAEAPSTENRGGVFVFVERAKNRIRSLIWRIWIRPVIYPLFYGKWPSTRLPFWRSCGADYYRGMAMAKKGKAKPAPKAGGKKGC